MQEKNNHKQSPSLFQKPGNPELKILKRKSNILHYYTNKDIHFYGETIVLYLDWIEEMLGKILRNLSEKKEIKMDKKIKTAKKSIDKKMDNLLMEDKKRDKKCEHAEKISKKRK